MSHTTYRLCVTLVTVVALSPWQLALHSSCLSAARAWEPLLTVQCCPCLRLIMALFWCHVFHPSTCPSLFPDKYGPECLPGDHDQGCLEKWGYNAYLIVNENWNGESYICWAQNRGLLLKRRGAQFRIHRVCFIALHRTGSSKSYFVSSFPSILKK